MTVVPSWATLIEALPDPAVVWDENLRAKILATGYAWRVKDTATQIEMMLIPPGMFQMGCTPSNGFDCFTWEYPVHFVALSNPFYMGRYEVTQAQWQARMGSNPSWWLGANRPVERVSWNTTQGFLAQTGMRLPTEAEWEYACRAGTSTAFPGYSAHPYGTDDDSLVGNFAWYTDNSDWVSHPVGGKLANGYGLHDMAGNVWEWVSDRYGPYSEDSQFDPTGPTSGNSRVVRGGVMSDDAGYLRSSARNPRAASDTTFCGFRVAKNP
jgi:formylglycine-generating enzyme required for sulfatase activity